MTDKPTLDELRQELKQILIDNLALEDMTVADIADDEVLFGTGLGLDSLDAVEIVVILQRTWNIDVKDMERSREIFNTIDTLAKYVHENL